MIFEIIPSLLVSTKEELAAHYAQASHVATHVQLDVLDQSLFPYTSFSDPEFIESLNPVIPFEIHLMIRDVDTALVAWNRPWVEKIIFHYEAVLDPRVLIKKIQSLGKLPGLAISPQTPLEKIWPFISLVDTALVMTVEPGRNGAPFLPAIVEKVSKIRKAFPDVNIEVDGGINPETVRTCVAAGANLFVVGSYLHNKNFNQRFSELNKIVHEV